MTRDEHRNESMRLLEYSERKAYEYGGAWEERMLARAQVHATLALTANEEPTARTKVLA